ncbi:hypothetical protein CsatB_030003 [Cannabis sativa]
MVKKSLKDNPLNHTSPVPAKRKLGVGTSKSPKSKYPRPVLENFDSDFELEPEFVKSPKSNKIVQSTDLFEDIIGKKIVEVIGNPSTPHRNTTVLEL